MLINPIFTTRRNKYEILILSLTRWHFHILFSYIIGPVWDRCESVKIPVIYFIQLCTVEYLKISIIFDTSDK